MPATMSSHRSIVWAATTTETSGLGCAGLLTAVVPPVAGRGAGAEPARNFGQLHMAQSVPRR